MTIKTSQGGLYMR